ncbi:hypothetical protein ACHMW6_00310 (plasmid) [Pseudoduganella sp. UC29_106]|uniref:hypothetical protein n=1 Tax=Pseudoduganella sp. UC29_106 TaxID=3374553 RepID=UPI003757FC94
MAFSLSFFWARLVFHRRRAGIYAALAFALDHGSPPLEEFKAVYRTHKRRNSPLATIYKHWHDQLTDSAAGSISKAMRGTVPTTEYALLASAEETHRLSLGLRFLSDSVIKINEMTEAVWSAISKIWLPAVMFAGLLVFCDNFFFPTIADTLPRDKWPTITRIAAGTASQLSALLVAIFVFGSGLVSAWYLSLSRWTGAGRKIADRTVLYSKYRDFQCAIFLVNLSFLMLANTPPRASLLRIQEHSNPYIRNHIKNMLALLSEDGGDVGRAIISTGLFNDELGDLMADYTRWGDWHTQIREIADIALRTVTKDIVNLGPKIESMLQLALGVCLMLLFASGGVAIIQIFSLAGFTH